MPTKLQNHRQSKVYVQTFDTNPEKARRQRRHKSPRVYKLPKRPYSQDGSQESLEKLLAMTLLLNLGKPLEAAQKNELSQYKHFQEVLTQVVDLFEGDIDAAKRWLLIPQLSLAGATPLQCALTKAGAQQVKDLIWRIEFGVFS